MQQGLHKIKQLSPLIFLDIMKVVTANNDSSHHLCTVASASKNPAPDRDIPSKGTFLINVGTYRTKAITRHNIIHAQLSYIELQHIPLLLRVIRYNLS